MNGLEQLRTALKGGRSGIAELLDITVVELEAGHVVFTLRPNASMLNPIGTVHGGVAAVLLDSVASCAVHSALAPGASYSTAQLNIHYTRAILPDTPYVTGVGDVVHVGRSVGTATGTITDDRDRVVAHGTVTCTIRS